MDKTINKMKKAIILAAGKSTRTFPLTVYKPKPMLKVLDKTILEHNLAGLKEVVDEIIIIVGFQKEKIIEKIGYEFSGIKVVYIEQKEQLGTGHAVMMAKDLISKNDSAIILNSDDLHSPLEIKKLASKKNSILAKRIDNPSLYGILKIDSESNMIDLIEKPNNYVGNLANTGCYHFDSTFLGYLSNVGKSVRNEIEITDAIRLYSTHGKVNIKILEIDDYWVPITYPWHYLEANVFLLSKLKESKVIGQVEDNVVIKGIVHLGKDSIIKSGTYIEGPVFIGDNCTIGPNAYIRKDTIIMNKVNTRAEIIDSVIMDNTTAKHVSYIGHSVLGENVNIAAGTITSDYRHDAKEHTTKINGNKVESKRKKLGAFIGDNVKTGIGTLIYPGRKMWPNTYSLPGEIISKDKI